MLKENFNKKNYKIFDIGHFTVTPHTPWTLDMHHAITINTYLHSPMLPTPVGTKSSPSLQGP